MSVRWYHTKSGSLFLKVNRTLPWCWFSKEGKDDYSFNCIPATFFLVGFSWHCLVSLHSTGWLRLLPEQCQINLALVYHKMFVYAPAMLFSRSPSKPSHAPVDLPIHLLLKPSGQIHFLSPGSCAPLCPMRDRLLHHDRLHILPHYFQWRDLHRAARFHMFLTVKTSSALESLA